MPLRLPRTSFTFLAGILLAGCAANPVTERVPGAAEVDGVLLTGEPSWFGLGGHVWDASECEEREKDISVFSRENCWFTGFEREVNKSDFEAWIKEQQARAAACGDSFWPYYASWPYERFVIPVEQAFPRIPGHFPVEGAGVRLSLQIQTTDDPGVLLFNLLLTSEQFNLWREAEHRWTNLVPFLFAFYADGSAVPTPAPEASFPKFGGVQYKVDLVPKGDQKTWSLKVSRRSIERLLAGAKAHTLSVVAAFSQWQFEVSTNRFGIGASNLLFSNKKGLAPEPEEAPVVLIRSNVVQIPWSGQEEVKKEKPWWKTDLAKWAPFAKPPIPETVEDAKEEMEETPIKVVEGESVGKAGQPGRFYLLSLAFLNHADYGNFNLMLMDQNPLYHAMGLFCLAQFDPPFGAQELKRDLSCKDVLTCSIGGVSQRLTVGQFACVPPSVFWTL